MFILGSLLGSHFWQQNNIMIRWNNASVWLLRDASDWIKSQMRPYAESIVQILFNSKWKREREREIRGGRKRKRVRERLSKKYHHHMGSFFWSSQWWRSSTYSSGGTTRCLCHSHNLGWHVCKQLLPFLTVCYSGNFYLDKLPRSASPGLITSSSCVCSFPTLCAVESCLVC